MVLTALLPVIVLLQLPVSDVIWKFTPHMKFLQFPWRWTLALSVLTCALAGMAVKKTGGRTAMFAGVLIAAMAIGGSLLFFQPCDDEDAVAAQLAGFRLGQGIQGTDEYTPVVAHNSLVEQHLPLVRLLRSAQDDTADSRQGDNPEWRTGGVGSIAATADTKRWNAEHWRVNVVTPESGYAVLRLMDYPSWRVTVDGKPAPGRPMRDDGLMAVPVMAGSHALEVQWTATGDVITGRAVSALALLALALVAIMERRGRRV
jgi:hypothetical protein